MAAFQVLGPQAAKEDDAINIEHVKKFLQQPENFVLQEWPSYNPVFFNQCASVRDRQ
ncbi:Hypothetical protein SMAX5B_007253, partial [Scophthalmus maximus]